MSKRKCGATVFLLLVAVAACVIMITRTEHPECRIESLVVDEEWMSGRWQIFDSDLWPAFLPIQDRLGAQEAYRMVMVNDDGVGIGHTVYQYRNRWLAAFHFWFDRAMFFPSVSTDWSELEHASHLPLHTDQQQILCGTAKDSLLGERCTAVLRYGSYISVFDASTSGEGTISLEEFEEIVLKIDERFSLCVE